jgi:suppressor of ftsI
MTSRVLIAVVAALVAGVVAGVLIADDGGDKTGTDATTTTAAADDTPNPFTAGMPFQEPRGVRSSKGVLEATLTAENGTVPVSGVEVAGAQTYTATWAGGTVKGGFLGPTLHAQPGDTVKLTLDNRLKVPAGPTAVNCGEKGDHDHDDAGETPSKPGDPESTNVHFHGLHVTPRETSPYGDTVLVRLPNGKSQISFEIPETHDKGTFWYHAHLHQCTNDQVSRGLAGLLLIGDSREDLPPRFRNVQTRSLALKDVQVTQADSGPAEWQIDPAHDFTKATNRTVNGLVNPTMSIRPGETQMWRLLNASAGVWYQVALVDEANDDTQDEFTVVAQDGNSLRRPVTAKTVLIPPGARFDILVRGPSAGKRVLKTFPFDQGFAKFGTATLATLEVKGPPAEPLAPPEELTPPHQRFPDKRGTPRRIVFDIETRSDQFHIAPDDSVFLPTINNALFDPDIPAVTPVLETTERWIIENKSLEWHPFHIHQDDFKVIRTSGGGPQQLPGDHDVVALPPGTPEKPSVVEIDMPFTDFDGDFVFHCHILGHEDAGMMALIELRKPGERD